MEKITFGLLFFLLNSRYNTKMIIWFYRCHYIIQLDDVKWRQMAFRFQRLILRRRHMFETYICQQN